MSENNSEKEGGQYGERPQREYKPLTPKDVRNRVLLIAAAVILLCIFAAAGVDVLGVFGL